MTIEQDVPDLEFHVRARTQEWHEISFYLRKSN
jgi:hypothetical protein